MINNSYHWVTGLKKGGFILNTDPEKAHKYKTRSSFSKHVKKYGLNVLQVGQRPKYYVVKYAGGGCYYLWAAHTDWDFKHKDKVCWRWGKINALKLSKTRAIYYAARLLNASIKLCS